MADNVLIPGAGSATAAADEVTYSGDSAKLQLVRPVLVSGSEGARTVVDLPGDGTAGLKVNLGADNDVTVTGTVTEASAAAIKTAVELLDDAVAVLGTDTYAEATTKGLTVGAVRRDADTTLVGTTNEVGPLQMDANGRLKVEAFSGETLPVSLTSTTVTGTVAVTDNSGSITVDAPTGTPVPVRIGDGTLQTSVVDETGASAVDALAVGGGTPHGAVDSGNPVKIGAKAANAFPTAEANADRVNVLADLFGRLLTAHIDPAQAKHANKNYTSTQTGTDVITPTSGKKLAITSVVIGTYGTTAGRIILWFGDNADTTFTQDTDQVLLAFSTAPSSTSKPGLVFSPAVPVFCSTADRELHITTDAAVSLDVTIEYYEW